MFIKPTCIGTPVVKRPVSGVRGGTRLAGIFVLSLSGAAGALAAEPNNSDELLEEVLVVAHPLSGEGLAQASDVLTGEELQRSMDTSIGATLAQQPGIRSATFGKAVGRPVIHGLGGPRVRVMEDRIDTLDVSVTSTDHAVTVEPFIADRIEVLKGPSALLYGSGAIGGVVDVHTGRIPHAIPEEGLSGGIESRYDNNTEGTATSAKLNGGAGKFAFHLDATFKDGDDYDIPGFAESARLRALEEAEEAEGGEEEGEHDEEEEVRGTLPGSAFDFESYAAGGSYVTDWGFVGVAVSRLEADYGLPGGHGHEEEGEHDEEEEGEHGEEEEGNPTLEVEQTRVDLELGITNPFGVFSSLNVRLGINDYEHQEIEPDGEVATNFENDAWELRSELVFETDTFSGAFGVQHTDRDFSAIGEEAFVPPVESKDSGVFAVVERPFDNFDLEAGLRFGRVEHDPIEGATEDFFVYAASLGAVVPVSDGLRLGFNADYSSRAPVAEELYSNGPHLATQAFEIGDPDLDNERAINLSATLNYESDRFSAAATVYYNNFEDFIYEQATGAIEDDLPVFEFRQDDARFIGVDAEANMRLTQWQDGELHLRLLFDFVDAELSVSGNDNLPRIPPLRYGAGLEFRHGILVASVDYARSTAQKDVAPQELQTSGYDDLRAYLGAEFDLGGATLAAFVAGKNLTDDEQRAHASFIKEFAPGPGRSVEAGLRLQF